MALLCNFFYLAFTIVSLFVTDTSSQATLPSCVQACLDAAASSSGCSPTDPVCVCNNAAIADAVATCVVGQCSVTDAQAAVTFFNEFCSGATSPSSASVSVEPSTIGSTETPSSILSTPGNTSTPPGGSPLFTSSFTSSEPATSIQPSTTQEQSTTGPTTGITSRSSTGSTSSPASVTSSTTSTTPGVTNHAERGRNAGSFISIVFALALALVI